MPEELRLEVADLTDLTPSVRRFVLRDPEGGTLPGYRGGAHVTVTTPSGERRSYSLVEAGSRAPAEYVIAVRRDPEGRGGSISLHDDVRVGDVLAVAPPANTFPIRRAKRYVFIAGGIGITPVRAMVAELRARGGVEIEVLYLSRTAEETAYLDEFAVDGTLVHHSSTHGRLDLWPHVAEPDDDTRIYCCGPTALIDEVLALTVHWRPSRVHVEDFAGVDAVGPGAAPFTVVWEPTGQRVGVPGDRSMLDALRRSGVEVASSCESGTCGSCRLRLVQGRAVHRDLVLAEDERDGFVMACVSRAETPQLVLAPVDEPA